MTETSAVAQLVREARHKLQAASAPRDPRLHIHIAPPMAKVLLLQGRFRDAAYVRRHVEYVLSRDAEQGEQHVRRNLGAIRRTLEEMGVDKKAIDAEVRAIEAAVRAEIWRQVLTPDGQQ
jgi:hypothetical protein